MSITPIPIGVAIDNSVGSNNGYLLTNPTRLAGGPGYEFTAMWWIKFNSVANNRRLMRKDGTGTLNIAHKFNQTDDIEFSISREGGGSGCSSSNGFISTGVWTWIVCAYDEAQGSRLFFGYEDTPTAEVTYASQDTGTGDTKDNSADLNIFYRNGTNRSIDGAVAYLHLVSRRLSVPEMTQVQFNPGLAVENTEALYFPGADGSVTTLTDYSGKGNDAPRQGSSQALAVGASVGYHKRRPTGLYTPIVAAGPSSIIGIADFNMLVLSVTGIGNVPRTGTADFDLPVPTVTALGNIPVFGVADFDLPVFDITAAGGAAVPVLGTADFNLPVPNITGVGLVPRTGIADFGLPVPTITGAGLVPRTGLADFDLPVLTIGGSGVILNFGVADFDLPFGLAAVGTVPRIGAADFNLPIITITGFGAVPRIGAADFDLPNLDVQVRGTTLGTVTTFGDADFNLPRLWVDTNGRIDVNVVNIFSVTGQTGAITGAAVALQRQAGAFFVNRDVLAQIVLGAGSATIIVEASLDGGSTFTDIITAATASTVASFLLPPLIRVRLSAATGATVNVFLDADLVSTRTDN